MDAPKSLRQQFKHYEAHGFHPVDAEPRCGSHWKVRFAEFPEAQFLTVNANDPRALKNNVCRFRRLAAQATAGSPIAANTLS